MKKVIVGIIVIALVIAVFGCARNKAGKKSLPETSMKNWPKWMLNPPKDSDHLFAAKTETSLKAQLAEEKATTAARADIAKQLETKVQSLEKKFDEEVGLGEDAELNAYYSNTIKIITSQTLNGSKVVEKKWIREGKLFRAFVLVDLPLGEFNKNFVKGVKKNKQLYDRFRASQSFQGMEKDMEKYEHWKKEQGE